MLAKLYYSPPSEDFFLGLKRSLKVRLCCQSMTRPTFSLRLSSCLTIAQYCLIATMVALPRPARDNEGGRRDIF